MSNVAIIPFPKIDGAYVIISARKSDSANGVKKNMSFFYDGGSGVGVEWEPDNGPFTQITSCSKDYDVAKKHWFYDYYTGNNDWSQLAVDASGIAEKFINGNYEDLFAILASWLDYIAD
jgi:hypothetical protein